ncbi:hypothetical protein RI129_008768 [Pyrocoelia pectoralis]|uniref:Laminin EGF-like domain-containing protein n=1 Tax=Pyrocoelia pectoralis TaxID=417401 RepID=A0AAN7VCK4_9COLE
MMEIAYHLIVDIHVVKVRTSWLPEMKNFGYLYFILSLNIFKVQMKLDNQTCNCSLLGTVSSIEGDSICDEETLQCKCYPNVTGLNCDECSGGHYGITSSEGCSSCSCNSFGSLDSQCDSVTGQCSCKHGHTGLTCDQCEPLKYGYQNGCLNCNCDVIGSVDLQCDNLGQCPCRENIEGKHCNQCKENTYNLTAGCIPCPPCYDLVLNGTLTLRNNVTASEKAIKHIEENLPKIIEDFENFIKEIQLLNDKIGKLKPNDTELTLDKHEKLFLELEQQITAFQDTLQSSLNKMKGIESEPITKLIEGIQTSLNDSDTLLQSGQSELKKAAIRSEEIVTHNKTVTEMSKSAQTMLEQIQKALDDISEYSTKISALTAETCSEAGKFEETEKKVASELDDLRSEVSKTTDGIMAAKKYATEFNQQTKETYQDAQLLEGQTSAMIIPEGDEMQQDYAKIESTISAIDGVINDAGETAKEFEEQVASMDAYLGSVDGQQKTVGGFLITAQGYQMRANSAAELAASAFAQGLSYMAGYAEYEQFQQSIKDLMKGAVSIQAMIDFINQHSTEVRHIFEELIEVIKGIEFLKLKTDGLLKLVEGNSDIILSNINLIEEIEQDDRDIVAKLEEYEVQLKSVRYNVDELNKIENETSDKIKEVEGYMQLLDLILIGEDTIEEEIEKLESMYDTIDELTKLKDILKEEVANVKEVLESLPIDNNTLCEAPESEPKLAEGG